MTEKTENENLALTALLEFLDAVEAGVTAAKQRVKEAKIGWNPDKIRWEETEGSSGLYQRSEDFNNPEFKVMLKDLQAHGGKLTRNGYFYWIFKNGSTVGRKKRN